MNTYSSTNYFSLDDPLVKIAQAIIDESEAPKDKLGKKDALGGDDDVIEVNPDLQIKSAPDSGEQPEATDETR